MGNIIGSSNEGGPVPTLSYFLSLRKLRNIDRSDFFLSRSNDGGKTAQVLEQGTLAILRHEDVVTELESYCENWTSGRFYRGNDLGLLRLSSQLWDDLNPSHMTLGATVKDHANIRPILDRICGTDGNWNKLDIFNHAKSYLQKEFIDPGLPFKGPVDLRIWVCIFLHRTMLNMELSYGEAKTFVEMQENLLTIIILPECALNIDCISRKMKLQDVFEFRRKQMLQYKIILGQQFDHLTSEAELHYVAAGYFDALMLAGGLSVPQGIHNALAVMYSLQSPKQPELEINESNLPCLVWETLRFFPLVLCVPYYINPEKSKRRLICLVTALRDRKVWGEDAASFRLRDIAQYQELSTVWAEQMMDKDNPPNNRNCPAKDLSYQMILNFLKAFLQKKDQFKIEKSVNEIKIIPEVSTWEFQTQSTF